MVQHSPKSAREGQRIMRLTHPYAPKSRMQESHHWTNKAPDSKWHKMQAMSKTEKFNACALSNGSLSAYIQRPGLSVYIIPRNGDESKGRQWYVPIRILYHLRWRVKGEGRERNSHNSSTYWQEWLFMFCLTQATISIWCSYGEDMVVVTEAMVDYTKSRVLSIIIYCGFCVFLIYSWRHFDTNIQEVKNTNYPLTVPHPPPHIKYSRTWKAWIEIPPNLEWTNIKNQSRLGLWKTYCSGRGNNAQPGKPKRRMCLRKVVLNRITSMEKKLRFPLKACRKTDLTMEMCKRNIAGKYAKMKSESQNELSDEMQNCRRNTKKTVEIHLWQIRYAKDKLVISSEKCRVTGQRDGSHSRRL